MIVPSWNDVRVAEEHFADMVREVEQDRYAAHAEALCAPAKAERRGLITRGLARVGRRMVAWGTRLEALAPLDTS